jgi:2-methylcitrate dehydratase PrpD
LSADVVHAPEADLGTIADRLGTLTAAMSFEFLPADVVQKAKIVLLDALAMAVAGRDMPSSEHVLRYADQSGTGPATILAGGTRASAEVAALANGVLIHALLQDDAHFESWAHPGTVVVPAALSGIGVFGSSGEQTITAIVAGYEMIARIGSVASAPGLARGFRATPLVGAFGAAAAYGKLGRLSAAELSSGLSLAANFACGLLEPMQSGHPEWRFQSAIAASNGILAASLAKAGVEASPTALEGPKGFFEAFSGIELDPESIEFIVGGSTDEYRILETRHKAHASAGVNQYCIGVTQSLMRDNQNLRPENVEAIEIAIADAVRRYPGCEFAGPFTTVERALASKPFSVVATLFEQGRPLLMGAVQEHMQSAEVEALCQRVTLTSIPESERPTTDTVRLRIRLTDGTVVSGDETECDPMDADPDWPHMVRKFEHMAGPRLGARTSEVVAAVADLEHFEPARLLELSSFER